MLSLKKIDPNTIIGIYGKSRAIFPERMAYLHPQAADAFLEANENVKGGIILSDMYRTCDASFARRYPHGKWLPRRGVARPGYSAHNFGLAIDVAVDATLDVNNWTKRRLDHYLQTYGWFCHRRDHKRGREDWHYNYLGVMGRYRITKKERTTAAAIERQIRRMYESEWLNVVFAEDNIKQFQLAWYLKPDGIFGPKTKRLYWLLIQQDRTQKECEKL